MTFKLQAPFIPTGDQPEAIAKLVDGIRKGFRNQVLLGATGTGKTFTVASVIQELQKPALIMAHNKTLAAQLYAEFKEFFPENAVEYFVSYYDYYQPEAYVPRHDLYIEKETEINEEIERLRLAATGGRGTLQRPHREARVRMRGEVGGRIIVVQPFMQVVVAGDVEDGVRPPGVIAGEGGEARADGVPDEQVMRRHGAPHQEKWAPSEPLKIKRSARRIANDLAAEAVVNSSTSIEVAEKSHCVAQEPGSRPRDGRQDRQFL